MSGVLILAGPTASGKTALAVQLALRFDAEIVGADSRQIYREMEIGTAAPGAAERAAVPHHLIGFLDPRERYSAARFARDAIAAIAGIHARGRRAIVVGGTGFYIRALCGDVTLGNAHDEAARARLALEARVHSPAFLHAWLATRDPSRAATLDPNDAYRVLRALELTMAAADSREEPGPSLRSVGTPFAKLFLDVPLEQNDRRIEERTHRMLASGLLEEAERIGEDAIAANAVGYPQALAYLRGWSTREEVERTLARATRRYARRQRSWFRTEPGTQWVAPELVEAHAKEKLGWS